MGARVLRPSWTILALLLAIAAVGCRGDHPDSEPERDPDARRDIAALQRVIRSPQACGGDGDCPIGSHCDDKTDACTWSCLADSECGPGRACDIYGRCVANISPAVSNDSDECAALEPAERRAALIALHEAQEAGPPIACFDDDDRACPCGSYCNTEVGICAVECIGADLPGEPVEGLVCTEDLVCTPSGRCMTEEDAAGPPLALTLALSERSTMRNTATGPVVVPLTITVSATSVTALQPSRQAIVRIGFAELREFEQGRSDTAPNPAPRVRCAADAPLASSCVLAGGWTFDVNAGTLRSAPKTIWVEIPATTTPLSWTLEARSQSAAAPAVDTIMAEPVINPATDPGRYRGTLALTSPGAAGASATELAVEAIVTESHIAVFEPTRIALPDGHVVLARDPAKATLVGWLTSGNARYDAVLGAPQTTYDPTTGALSVGVALVTGAGAAPGSIELALARTGNVEAAACPCGTGAYCNATMARCLPGEGPPSGGIVNAAAAVPSSVLPSAMLAPWIQPLSANAIVNAPDLVGTGRTGIERAYCFRDTGQPDGVTLGTEIHPLSGDLMCKPGGVAATGPYLQPMFGLTNRESEYDADDQGGPVFDLFETCLDDLAATPSGTTPNQLLAQKTCVSLGRFFRALEVNVQNGVGQPLPAHGQRLVHQLVRQWLGVTAYVATTAIQVRKYDDVLARSSVAAHERLGRIVDRIDEGLRVLLDQRVRPQLSTGTGLGIALREPDHRVPLRPVARWTFNERVNPVPDAEGAMPFFAPGVDLTSGDLNAWTVLGDRRCTTAGPIALEDRRFTISADLRYVPLPGSTTIALEKFGLDGDRLRLEITTADAGGHLILTLRDSRGGVASFPPIEAGFIAIAVGGTSYRLLHGRYDGTVVELAATSVVNGGPRWGSPGIVALECNLPLASGTCRSWDRNVVGDGLDVALNPTYVTQGPTSRYSCTTQISPRRRTCTHQQPQPAPGACTSPAATKRTQIIQGLFPNPPSSAVAALTVTGATVVVDQGSSEDDEIINEWTDWRCDFTVKKHPMPIMGTKPVCGVSTQSIRWDEVSLWDRPILPQELGDMSLRYGGNTMNESLPSLAEAPAGKEQATALPVHLLEAASADLDLLAEYVGAERAAMYEQCSPGRPLPARVGRNLRLVSILEAEAAHLAALPEAASAPWRARYEAAQRMLAGRRARAMDEVQLALQCHNPLGITEDQLPLFVGEDIGPSARFFATSDFLVTKAREQIAAAEDKLGSARSKYIQQRQSAYQLDEAREGKLLRETKLRADYESALVRYCGQPHEQTLLDGFLAGTTTANNCFIKTELPECRDIASLPVSYAPPACLRGDLGARLLTIHTAGIDVTNADAAHRRALEKFDADTRRCREREAHLKNEEIKLAEHHQHMEAIRTETKFWGFVYEIAENPRAVVGDLKSIKELADYAIEKGVIPFLAGSEADEREAYERSKLERDNELVIEDCYYEVENQKFAMDAAVDVIQRALQDVVNAQHQLANDLNQIAGIVDAAAGQLAVEAELTSTPPHHHFWLDEDISDYHRHFAYAKRLTYLALRALEYESQQRLTGLPSHTAPGVLIGARTAALTASRPSHLTEVVRAIDDRNAPMEGVPGFVVGQEPQVRSLRDEILRLPDLSTGTGRLPGEAPMTPERALKRYLRSNSSKIIDANGRFIGRGIRFSLRPDAWTEYKCAERIWRITPSLQMDNPPTQHQMVLYQENSFGSQDCRGEFGDVIVSRTEPTVNLLTGDRAAFARPSSSTAVTIVGPLGLDHETLRNRAEGDIAGFAGRGLYSNYVLLFPPLTWTDEQIAKIKDVLLRFDIVHLTNAPAL
jgi:hypothetical protein